MDDSPTTDAALLSGAKAGDNAAATALCDRYRAMLTRYASHYLSDADAADDVVQDALTKLITTDAGDAAARDSALKPWLFAVVRNACVDALRRKQRSPTANHLRTGVDVVGQRSGMRTRADRKQRQELLRDLIAAMPEEHRSVLVLKYLEKQTRSEIAAVLGISETAVKGRLARATARLEEALRQHSWARP